MNTTITMTTHAENYLSERRRLGFGLRNPGYAVLSFARYIDALNSQERLTVEMMADWARQDQGHSDDPATWARRLKNLRSFCRYLQQFEPLTEVPDDNIFGRVGQRLAPHIYSEQEIIDLLAAAHNLDSFIPGLRGATYETLFGLLASTGLRISEALHLLDSDVDLKAGILAIRQTKFAKSRYVPLHPSTVEVLKQYRSRRNIHIPVTEDTPFFISTRGRLLGIDWILGRFIGYLSNYVTNWAGSIGAPTMARAFTTCVIRLSSAGYCYGKPKAWMSTNRCWLYPPMSGMPWSPIRTGTLPAFPS